jgi:hypothetical protein
MDLVASGNGQMNTRAPRSGRMSFETVSLLMNYLEIGVLLAILFRLGRTFELIANTQRELRRTILSHAIKP